MNINELIAGILVNAIFALMCHIANTIIHAFTSPQSGQWHARWFDANGCVIKESEWYLIHNKHSHKVKGKSFRIQPPLLGVRSQQIHGVTDNDSISCTIWSKAIAATPTGVTMVAQDKNHYTGTYLASDTTGSIPPLRVELERVGPLRISDLTRISF